MLSAPAPSRTRAPASAQNCSQLDITKTDKHRRLNKKCKVHFSTCHPGRLEGSWKYPPAALSGHSSTAFLPREEELQTCRERERAGQWTPLGRRPGSALRGCTAPTPPFSKRSAGAEPWSYVSHRRSPETPFPSGRLSSVCSATSQACRPSLSLCSRGRLVPRLGLRREEDASGPIPSGRPPRTCLSLGASAAPALQSPGAARAASSLRGGPRVTVAPQGSVNRSHTAITAQGRGRGEAAGFAAGTCTLVGSK
ncbi:PREDICTED: uncharacterized protein LOC102021261 [Chinchilla lanigera]|uniref:uncharacterized protein LOC102021261 n=1 Tax=Chinchilla lanigera TaxID=34839 RepID=UPI0006973CED|nr:PREDICTED: uncharacterized protein LOC102021261 [Chinchilla lanigera]